MDYATKITEIEKKLTDHNNDKYITTPEINTLAASVFNARLDNKNRFWSKTIKSNRKITANKSKNLLVENKNICFKLFYWQKSLWRR